MEPLLSKFLTDVFPLPVPSSLDGEVYVYSNLATSLDGKIATTGREFLVLGSPNDLRLLRKLRNDADAVVYGAEVLRAFRRACLPLDAKHRLTNAVLSRSLEGIDPDWEFFTDPRIDRILYVTGTVPRARRRRFSESSILVKVSAKNPARDILRDLRKRRFSHIGVEGGGVVMWEFVSLNAIDRYYLTLTPRLVGGKGAPTLVDGVGFNPNRVLNVRLETVQKRGSELFLTYVPLKKRGRDHPEL